MLVVEQWAAWHFEKVGCGVEWGGRENMLRSMIRFLWQRLCNRSRTKVQQKITVVVINIIQQQ